MEKGHPASPPEGPRARIARTAGIALFVLSAFLPVYGCRASPNDFEDGPDKGGWYWIEEKMDDVPVVRLLGFDDEGGPGSPALARLWDERRFYPYLLVPFWISALASSRGGAPRRRRAAVVLLALSVSLVVFEGFYLWFDFTGAGPRWSRRVERVAIWIGVAAVLWFRRRGRGRIEDPEAAVSALALLSLLHALAFPVSDIVRWADENSLGAMIHTLSVNYKPGYWVAVAGLGLVAAPGYFSGTARRRYDPALPCPSASSTATPTWTSTGSTRTGTRSSGAPSPPASPPS